ncbi:hypothetical protein Cri9333_4942 (plasmid) [Crinalium epipsammum PCC 9333]|uniref:Uncharacterized protein n=1 Tax=Crinalium epipsammum PCC 9333 TaxID=1173022 RepID=K9W5S3_9CYAN|nr:hypothetical protein [Crinalium epipsammum]AFZ15698.1 hypothetical protein Cri9333_4942 [Crinalium epipsammum PCC 9333]
MVYKIMLTDVRPIQPHTTERITLLVGDQLIRKTDALGLESSIIFSQLIRINCTPTSFIGGAAW